MQKLSPIRILYSVVLLSIGILSTRSAAQTVTPRPVPPPAVRVFPGSTHIASPAQIAYPKGAEPQAQQYNSGDPTPEEQYILELINRARANPKAEGDSLAATNDQNIKFQFQNQSPPTASQVKTEFSSYPSRPPLAINASLISAARGHSQDMLTYAYQGHDNHDGTTFDVRIRNAGYTGTGYLGENVFAYGTDPHDAHQEFQCDFGNYPGIGHRHNIMNFDGSDPIYNEIGLGCLKGSNGGVGPFITTEDFGQSNTTFILGVVYNDANHNGFYDVGEGVSGVTITVQGGQYYAVSSTSGGYAIPYSGSGSVKVTAALTGGSQSQTITVNGQNVKVDFAVNGLPGEVTLLTPSIDTTVNSSSATFTWAMDTGATTYHIQVGTDTAMTKSKLIVNDSTVTTLSRQVTGLKDTTTYYWRMRAKNSRGWGVFSPVQSFSVALAPNRVVVLAPASSATVPGDVPVVFSWQPATPRVTSYWLQVAKNGGMTPPFVISDTIDASMTSDTVQFSRLQGNTTYYWQVLAQNDGGWSQPSIMRTFSTAASSVNPDVLIRVVVSVSPNPTSGDATFYYTTNSDPVVLRVYNSLGIEVTSASLGQVPWGTHEYHLDCSGLAAGEYMYQMTIGRDIRTGHFVVVR